MKIKKIHLKNFRMFDDLDIDFSERLTVLTGINGSGKTSIISALGILLSRLIGRIRSTTGTGRFFSESDIKIGASETVNYIETQILDEIISWQAAKTKRGRQQQTISNLSELKKIVKNVQGRGRWRRMKGQASPLRSITT